MITMVNVNTGREVEAPTGFSFTGLLFGLFVPLFRGDYLTTLVCAAVCVFTAGVFVPVVWLFLAFCYNGYAIRRLEEKGWVTALRYHNLKAAGKVV